MVVKTIVVRKSVAARFVGSSPTTRTIFFGGIAQWLEQDSHKVLAVGSNPTAPTITSYSSVAERILYKGRVVGSFPTRRTTFSNKMKITIEIEGKKFEAEGDYVPTILDQVLHEAGILEEEENIYFLDKQQQRNYYRCC